MDTNLINELITNRYVPHFESLDANVRRIYEGTQTSIKFFPFIAAVQVFGQFYCAGSIIAADLVITAASCLQLAWNNTALHENSGFITVRVGSSYHTSGGEVINVKDLHFHPDFDPANLKGNLCILRLRKRLFFDDKVNNVKRIKFDEEAKHLPISLGGLSIIGWGARNQETASVLSDVLSYAVIDIFKYSDCQDIYSKDYVREENFCAGFVSKGGGACGNDVGDPGLVNGLLTGIVSFGSPTCGARDAPTVFIKLGYFAGWIHSVIDMKESKMNRVNDTIKPGPSTNAALTEIQTDPTTEVLTTTLSTINRENAKPDSNMNNISLTVQKALRTYFGNDDKMYKAFLKTCQEKDIRLFANLLGVNITNQSEFITSTKKSRENQNDSETKSDHATNESDELNSNYEDDEKGNHHHQKHKIKKRKHHHHRSQSHKSKINKAKFRNIDSDLYSESELSLDLSIGSWSKEDKESKSKESTTESTTDKPIIRHEILDMAKKFISDFQTQNANVNKKEDSEEVVDDIIDTLKTNQYKGEINDIFKVLNIPTNIEYDSNKNANTDNSQAKNIERFLNALEHNIVVSDNPTTVTSPSPVPVERKIEANDEGMLSKALKYVMTWVS